MSVQGLINMTPGIHKDKSIDYDQKYRNPTDVDTDIFIVGRLYIIMIITLKY